MPSEVEEIEAILREHVSADFEAMQKGGPWGLTGIPEAAAAIAALRSQDRGAREMRERAAILAQGNAYEERYRTWAFWPPSPRGGIPNRDKDSELARHSADIAAAIRALPLSPVRMEDGRDA